MSGCPSCHTQGRRWVGWWDGAKLNNRHNIPFAKTYKVRTWRRCQVQVRWRLSGIAKPDTKQVAFRTIRSNTAIGDSVRLSPLWSLPRPAPFRIGSPPRLCQSITTLLSAYGTLSSKYWLWMQRKGEKARKKKSGPTFDSTLIDLFVSKKIDRGRVDPGPQKASDSTSTRLTNFLVTINRKENNVILSFESVHRSCPSR